ncbi:MAG TPA: arginine repressor [Kofleriaceae bacterium]|jgi:transcriptional regulator of arginine metabolism
MPETTETRARRAAIVELVRTRHVGTQAELGTLLSARGYEVTQATLSRDLAKLRARRVSLPDGGTAYEVAGFEARTGAESTQLATLSEHVLGVQDGAAMVVVHTRPGVAPAVAALIDQARIEAAIGTIAGDDTIFVAPARNVTAKQLAKHLAKLFDHG